MLLFFKWQGYDRPASQSGGLMDQETSGWIEVPGYERYDGTIEPELRGYERIGSVGDLRIRYLAPLTREGRTRVWVIGYLKNPNHPQVQPDAGNYQSELFALVWHMIRSDLYTILLRAKACLRGVFRRK
jgi:hypothetical protein